MLRATPVEHSQRCSNRFPAAVMSRATPSEGQFSADCSQASSHAGGEGGKHRSPFPIPVFFPYIFLLGPVGIESPAIIM